MRPIGVTTIVAVVVSLVAISSSAPMIAAAAAPALAIAFWRNAFAVGALAPVAAVRRRDELRKLLRSRDGRRCALAGVALAVHFATWVPSAKLTSVATSVALVSTMPVWTALLAVVRRMRVPRPTWLGIAVATAGAALASGADVTVSGRAVAGDALALAGAMAAAVYATLGEQVRATTSTTAYTTICYSVCAVAMGLACLVSGTAVVGFDGRTWLAIVAMTIGPQLLGHSLINYSLRRISAPTMGVLLLLEVPGAALFAWLFLDQLPAARSVPGLVLLMAGVAVVVVGARLSDERRYRDLPGRDGYHVP